MISVNSNQWKTFFSVHSKTENNKKKDPSEIEKLPSELKQLLASFLSTTDLFYFAKSFKAISSDLNLSVASSPLTDRASQSKKLRTNRKLECFAVVIPKQQEPMAHSMIFRCKVQNMGFCSCSKVRIVEQDLPAVTQSLDLLRTMDRNRGKTKAGNKPENKKLCLAFTVKPNKFYQFYISTNCITKSDYVQFSDMELLSVGFRKPSTTSHVAYQFDVYQQKKIRRRTVRLAR